MSDLSASPERLPREPVVPDDLRARLREDYVRWAESPPDEPLDVAVARRYGLDLATHYADHPLRNPFGKASGQLSMTPLQVAEDVAAGLGFVVLKTVIACDSQGQGAMSAWAIPEAKMTVEPITGRSGRPGWTVSWKGRGWSRSFDEYLTFVREATAAAGPDGPLIVPSCKYHLPSRDGEAWRVGEYEHATRAILAAWRAGRRLAENPAHPVPDSEAMPLEKDFSPTLAGSDLARERERIVEWLLTVPRLVRAAVRPAAANQAESPSVAPSPLRIGLKIFNALFDDAFQVHLLQTVHGAAGESRADFLVHANRLFDPQREYDGHRGIAYGGPDLSDRNLRTMDAFLAEGLPRGGRIPWSATGNIVSGRLAVEYALRGATSFQSHTLFQLPSGCFRRQRGTKTEKALHELYLHPDEGFVVWLHHLAGLWGLSTAPLRFADVVSTAVARGAASLPGA